MNEPVDEMNLLRMGLKELGVGRGPRWAATGTEDMVTLGEPEMRASTPFLAESLGKIAFLDIFSDRAYYFQVRTIC